MTASGFAWYKYADLNAAGDNAEEDDIFLPPFVSTLSGYYYNKYTWLTLGIIFTTVTLVITLLLLFLFKRIQIAIELIEEASKAVGEMPSILFFPIVPFTAQLLVVIWFIIVGMFLATSGTREYKVVDITAQDTQCINPVTQTIFSVNDECDPDTFPVNCAQNCDAEHCAQCVFHKYGPSLSDSWLQVFNCFGLFWLLFFMSALGEMVIAGSISGWYWTLDKGKTIFRKKNIDYD